MSDTTSRPAALISGGSGGIGVAIAQRLAAEGYDLTLSARRRQRLDEAALTLRLAGVRVVVEPADMALEADVVRVANAHRDAFSRLDLLVLAAGVGTAGAIEDVPLHRFDKQFAVNVRAPFLLTRTLLPLMRSTAQRSGKGARVVAISSITGVYAEPSLAAYGASKAALSSLCRSLNTESSDAGVTATAISPGYVNTEMSEWVHDSVPADRMIKASDIAELTLALTRLSAQTVIPEIVLTRSGEQLYRA